MEIIFSIFAFIIAIIVLVTVHEFGHYWVAKKLGVKVLKFSIGFGKTLLSKQIGDTEFAISAIPLGGYVKMLDSREVEVKEQDLHQEFNSQPISSRALIVAAGPFFNFLFAILAYWLVFMLGVTGLQPIVGKVDANSIAAKANIQVNDKIVAIQNEEVKTWSDIFENLVKSSSVSTDIKITVVGIEYIKREVWLDTKNLLKSPKIWFENFGISPSLPDIPAIIGEVVPNYPADKAGIKSNDTIIALNGKPINNWQQLTTVIQGKALESITLKIKTFEGLIKTIVLTPDAKTLNGKTVGQIGVIVKTEKLPAHYLVEVKYSFFDSFVKATVKTWQYSKLTLVMIAKMITGDVSAKENIGGPISIAKFAGDSLFSGFTSFLGFLAVISISLGVLNLLPIPILDGGHLFLYLLEFVKGSPLPQSVETNLNKFGMILLLLLMVYVICNDIAKLI